MGEPTFVQPDFGDILNRTECLSPATLLPLPLGLPVVHVSLRGLKDLGTIAFAGQVCRDHSRGVECQTDEAHWIIGVVADFAAD